MKKTLVIVIIIISNIYAKKYFTWIDGGEHKFYCYDRETSELVEHDVKDYSAFQWKSIAYANKIIVASYEKKSSSYKRRFMCI